MKKQKSVVNSTKKRKILLGTLIPVGVVGIALGTALPLTLCKSDPGGNGGGGSDPDEKKIDLPANLSAIAPSFPDIKYGYSGPQTTSASFTVSGMPADYTGKISYTLNNESSPLLSINSSNQLVLAVGASVGTISYEFSVEASADAKYNARTYGYFSGDITINLAEFNNFTISAPLYDDLNFDWYKDPIEDPPNIEDVLLTTNASPNSNDGAIFHIDIVEGTNNDEVFSIANGPAYESDQLCYISFNCSGRNLDNKTYSCTLKLTAGAPNYETKIVEQNINITVHES